MSTLVSIGTGRYPGGLKPHQADGFNVLDWIVPILDTYASDACVQQVRLVDKLFGGLDFRRFEMDLPYPIPMDDASAIPALTDLGVELGEKILHDRTDDEVRVRADLPQ